MSIYKNGKLIAGGRQCMPLLSFMWSDHILNDASWLRADTFSWQKGSVYQAAYQHWAADIVGKTLQSETVSGTTVQFYLADDGHKICPASEETNVAAIYTSTGVAWYYIIDTTNQRFKLPRVSPDKANVLDTAPVSVGVYGDGNALMTRRTSDGATGVLTCYAPGNPNNSFYTQGFSAYNGTVGISTNPANSGLVGSGTATTNGATTHYSGKKYLYFYVGNFTQTALENTAGVVTEDFNELNAHKVIEFQEPTAANSYTWYRLYADGWVEQGGLATTSQTGTTVSFPIAMADTNYQIQITCKSSPSNYSTGIVSNSITTTSMAISTYTEARFCCWQVSGMAA